MANVAPEGGQPGWPPPPPPHQPPSPPPPGGTTPPVRPSNGFGTAALVLGIIALLASWIPVVGLVLGILAVVLAIVGLVKANRGQATNRGQSIAGLITGVLAVAIGAVVTVVVLALFNNDDVRDFGDCLGDASSDVERTECAERFEDDLVE